MLDIVEALTNTVLPRLRAFGLTSPSAGTLRALFRIAYGATLRTEEGRFLRSSLTYANPLAPDLEPPFKRRAYYPAFTPLSSRVPLTVETTTKLARAIDSWSGSIAVWGRNAAGLFAWGILDQLVEINIRRNREADTGFGHPGVLTVNMDGIGAISAYHEETFLAGIRNQTLVTRENDALRSLSLIARVEPFLAPLASGIAGALGTPDMSAAILAQYFASWTNAITRLCIGLRRLGTGGSFLISPDPVRTVLTLHNRFPYARLGDALALQVLDDRHLGILKRRLFDTRGMASVPRSLVIDAGLAEVDAEDRRAEVTGATKLVISLAAVDGCVLLTPTLGVIGFGVKIGSTRDPHTVYDGHEFSRKGRRASTVDLSRFGTRHTSMLRYCRVDQRALGVVVSQDGQVRVIVSSNQSLLMWDNVKLLGYEEFSAHHAELDQRRKLQHEGRVMRRTLGYSSMPKTVRSLLARAMSPKGSRGSV